MKLKYGIWPEMHKEAVSEPINKPETPGQGKRYDIDVIMRYMSTKSYCRVLHFRRGCEDTPIGRDVVRCHPDRRLYAVLVPTRAESLQRIRNVLSAMDSESIRKCRERVEVQNGKTL